MHFQGEIVHFFSSKTRRREGKVLKLLVNSSYNLAMYPDFWVFLWIGTILSDFDDIFFFKR